MRKLFPTLVFLLGMHIVYAQNHYLVELEKRSPDVEALVRGYENQKCMPFMANDIYGTEQSWMNYTDKGKNVILWFWKMDCPKCVEQLDALNLLQQKYADQLQIISLADDDKASLQAFAEYRKFGFPIVPNSKTLADGPFGGDLGYPRIFILASNGMTKWVFPQDHMKSGFDTFNVLETLQISLSKSSNN